MKKKLRALQPHLQYVPFALVAIVMLGIFIIALVRMSNPPPPPIAYTQAEYKPDKAVYAPGETMTYSPTLRVLYDGQITGLRSYWDATRHRAARLCNGTPAPRPPVDNNLPAGEVGNIIAGTSAVTVTIPLLPPGDYWLTTHVHGYGRASGEAGYFVGFKVVKPC